MSNTVVEYTNDLLENTYILDIPSRELLFYDNIKLVNYTITKYNLNTNMQDIEDLLQVGYIGLWVACLKYNPKLGYTFSSYAIPTILGFIRKYLRGYTDLIRRPRRFYDAEFILYKENIQLPLRDSDIEYITNKYNISEYYLTNLVIPTIYSIDSKVADTEDLLYKDTIPDPNDPYEDIYDINKIIEDLLEVSHITNPRHYDLMKDYLITKSQGIKITQTDLGRRHGYTQTYVCRMLERYLPRIASHIEEVL